MARNIISSIPERGIDMLRSLNWTSVAVGVIIGVIVTKTVF